MASYFFGGGKKNEKKKHHEDDVTLPPKQELKNAEESEHHTKLYGKLRLTLSWINPKKKKFELSCTTFTGNSVDKTVYFDYPDYKGTGAIVYKGTNSDNQEEISLDLDRVPKEVEIITFAVSNFYDAYFEVGTQFTYSFVDAASGDILAGGSAVGKATDSAVFLCFLYRPPVPEKPHEFRLKNLNLIYNKRCRVMLDIIPEIGKQLSKESKLFGVSTTPFHTIFALDASGSMSGAPWRELCDAVKKFVQTRVDVSPEDLYSIVIYDSHARVVCEKVSIVENPHDYLVFSGGGTSFAAALNSAYGVIEKNNFSTHIPLLLFLSDGESSDGTAEMQKVASNFVKKGLQVYTVGFGNGSSHSSLKAFADVGKGKFLLAANGLELGKTFAMISDEMVSKK